MKRSIDGFVRGTAAASPGYTLGTWAGSGDSTCMTGQVRGLNNEIVIQEVYNSPTTSPLCLLQQSGPVSLQPGASVIIYFKNPTSVYGTTDSGVSSTIGILAGTAPVSQTVRFVNS
jgi:hypothetical protein